MIIICIQNFFHHDGIYKNNVSNVSIIIFLKHSNQFIMFFNVGLSVPLVTTNAYMTMCSCYGYPLQHRCCRRCYQMNVAGYPAIVPTPIVPAIVPSVSIISHTTRVCAPPAPVIVQRPCSYPRRSSVCSNRRR